MRFKNKLKNIVNRPNDVTVTIFYMDWDYLLQTFNQ